MKKFWVLFFCLFTFHSVSANFLVFPQKLIFDGKVKKQSIKLTNMSENEKTYKINIVNYIQNKDGGYRKEAGDEKNIFSAESYIRYSPKKFTIQPKETQTINVMIKKTPDMKEGEYRSHISFVEQETAVQKEVKEKSSENLSFEIKADMAINLPVVIRLGRLDLEINIGETNLRQEEDKTYMDVVLKREGNKSFRGNIKILSEEREIGIVKNVVITPELKMRKVIIPLYDKERKKDVRISDLKGKKITVIATTEAEDLAKAETRKEIGL